MSGTVNSGEVKAALVVDLVAGDLAVGVPRPPGPLNVKIQAFNPSAGALSGNGTVSISRVEEHLVVILEEYLVDPEGSLELQMVLRGDLWAAHRPTLHAVGDVEGTSHICAVDVV